jgi:hypothetical protein
MNQAEFNECLRAVRLGDDTEIAGFIDMIRSEQMVVTLSGMTVTMRVVQQVRPKLTLFAQRMRLLHIASGPAPLTLRAIGREMDTSNATIHRLMRGHHLPDWPLVSELIELLGGDPSFYADGYRLAKEEQTLARGRLLGHGRAEII